MPTGFRGWSRRDRNPDDPSHLPEPVQYSKTAVVAAGFLDDGVWVMGGLLGKWLKVPTLSEQLRAHGVREDLISAAQRTAFGRQSDRELPILAGLLTDDEVVLRLLEGRHGGSIGLLVLSSRRLVFAAKGPRGTTPAIVDLDDVVTADSRIHRGLGIIDVTTRSGEFVVDKILGTQAAMFVSDLTQALARPTETPARRRDPLVELAELRALHQAGVIADPEFQIRKQQLFGQI